MNQVFWFNLNSTSQEFSQVEVEEVFKQEGYHWSRNKKGSFYLYHLDKFPTTQVLNRLGGTIWVGKELDKASNLKSIQEKVEAVSQEELKKHSFKRFALWFYDNSKYDPQLSQSLSQELKAKLKLSYLNFRQPRLSRKQLQSNLILTIIKYKKTFYLLQLIWYYPWENFIWKDKSKIFVQPTAGMLPHKLSRMMVNLSLPTSPTKLPDGYYLLDPFAGSGTILIEALDQGIPVVGIEKNPTAFAGLKANLDNFLSKIRAKTPYQLYQGNVSRLHRIVKEKIIAVASEPYLGPAFRWRTNRYQKRYLTTSQRPDKHIDQKQIMEIINNLEKLYYLWLKHQALILKPETKVVVIFPLLHFHERFYRIKLIDNHRLEGYTLYQGPFVIKSQRDLAVRRQILVLRRK